MPGFPVFLTTTCPFLFLNPTAVVSTLSVAMRLIIRRTELSFPATDHPLSYLPSIQSEECYIFLPFFRWFLRTCPYCSAIAEQASFTNETLS